MLSLGRVTGALDAVRSGKVIVNDRALNRLLSVFVDVHSTEFVNELDLELIEAIEILGNTNDSYSRPNSRGSDYQLLRFN